MNLRRLHLFPGALCVFVILTLIAVYCVAVFCGHVRAALPLISDVATQPPESCIFGQCVNVAVFFMLPVLYVRYLQIEALAASAGAGAAVLPRWCNRAAAAAGLLSCAGLDIVANFQETNVLPVHVLGAFLCFFFATIFFGLQTFITYKTTPHLVCIFYLRAFISVACVTLCVVGGATGVTSYFYFDVDKTPEMLVIVFGILVWKIMFPLSGTIGEDQLLWGPEDGGFALHLTASVSEWLLALCFFGFVATFTKDFRGLVLQGPFLKLPETPKNLQTV